ncbi:rod shape-determining protein MreD [Falsirhodobacter halotolerans]|uniref:rod shape-determining protein MreD n=1 Tax=Falsirhodobacter halotolerans TaxID=1146892 RepID=UPI001FD43C43|nr:rod shape-determining protein MreD [Falsirhodobacter halotolerans]MCJ8138840.1 rod shape-determining protein MreD [Falsirhodobacter halotolerans]
MTDTLWARRWLLRCLYVALGMVLITANLLPLGGMAGGWPGPAVLLCITLAWTLRRPDAMAVWLIALVILTEDFLLMRPPGLWAALTVLATEFLRRRPAFTRELNWIGEWALMAVLIVAMTLAYRFVFSAAFLPQVPLGYAMLEALATILCYPVVVAISTWGLGLHKPATGEIDAYGRRM